MKNTVFILILILNVIVPCKARSNYNCGYVGNFDVKDSDTTIVNVNEKGDTIDVHVFSDSLLLETREYYSGNRLRMVKKYKDGFLVSIVKSFNANGDPVYPGTFLLGTGSIIEYNEKGRMKSVEYWSSNEVNHIEYYLKRRIKRVVYANNLPVYSVMTRPNGRVESKTTYDRDGTSIIRTEYFDEKLNVIFTLYGH